MDSGARNSSFAWLQLLRLANGLTAVADVAMGYLVTHGDLRPYGYFVSLAAASCLLYLSGMVLNDVFDVGVDARERPQRPIPSGRVSLSSAAAVGWAMLSSGVLVAWFISFMVGNWRPGAVATLLAVCVVLYDAVLKRTPVAPLAMGACRTLNVLLGMSLAPLAAEAASPYVRWGTTATWLIAIGIGVYIVGVTIFARTEARASSRTRLIAGLAVLLAGMALLAATPALSSYDPPLKVSLNGWYLLWAALALITARRCGLAVTEPSQARVQAAVRHCVQSIIVLDATVCVGYASPLWGLVVLSLIFPTVLLAQWLKAT
ncbi:MAG TPA: UbiA family prenyltransferase [Lacipirellulaceae bacterium]|nr:UbiA family prenyltransferase [Lacipirellulaceae bacterium]